MKDWTKVKATDLQRGDIIENVTVSGKQVTDEIDSVTTLPNGRLQILMKASSQIEFGPDLVVDVYR